MLLKIVTFTGDIACYLNAVRQTYSGYLTKGWVRLLGSCGLNSSTYTTLLRWRSVYSSLVQRVVALLQSRCCRLLNWCLTSLSDQLIECRHIFCLLSYYFAYFCGLKQKQNHTHATLLYARMVPMSNIYFPGFSGNSRFPTQNSRLRVCFSSSISV